MRWRWLRQAALAAVVLAGPAARVAGAAEPASILLIYADPRLLPAVVAMDQTLRSTIESRAATPVRFYSEYLDLSWFPADQEIPIGHTIRQKYVGRKFDLVVTCGESALRFALRERDSLFPGVPMVFCTVEDAHLPELHLPPDVTGVTMFRDWAAGLDLILTLHPSTRRIAFVSGAGAVESLWERLAREAFTRYEGRLTFVYLTGQPIDQTIAAAAALGEGDVIVFNALLRDGAGRTFSSPEALGLLSPKARVPMYGFAGTQIGHGIVGGVLVSYEGQARRAGELALRVLAGERLGPADVVRRAPNTYEFDARQLARWRIPEDRLPPGSVVEFREPGLWRQHKWKLLAGVVLVAAQTLLVVGLLAERRQTRRARRRLDRRLRFEMLVADLAASLIEVPAGEIDARIDDGLGRVLRELGLDRAGLAEFTGADGELRVTRARSRDGLAAAPAGFTREGFPWTLGTLQGGHPVCFARLADLPPEAVVDRRSFQALGTKSVAIVPVLGSGTVLGGLGCVMLRHERRWSAELVQRLRLLADVFAVVLIRRRAEHVLAESEGRFHVLTDAAPVMMWLAGPDGRCTDFNRAWLDFTGRALADELGDGWLEGVHPDDREGCMGRYLTALAARKPFTLEYRLRRSDGAYHAVLDTGVPRFDTDQAFQGYVGSATDVTVVKAAQQSHVESLALRSAILGSLYGRVAALDRGGVIIAVNEAWTGSMEPHGIAADAAGVGVNYLDVCRRAMACGDTNAGPVLEAIEDVRAGRTSRALLEYASPGPVDVRWYAMIVEPLKRPEGGLVISHIDVTRRRHAEEAAERGREDLAHALRVATVGELATSIAHEINQPLTAITTNAQAARRSLAAPGGASDEIPEILRDIEADALRTADIIRRLRALVRKEPTQRQAVDGGEIVKEVVGLVRKDLERRNIRLDVALEPGAPRVMADVVQLQQVLLNVLLNAAEAMTDGDGPRDVRVELHGRQPGRLVLTVADSGGGVPASELERIFDQFVTSKRGGLGLGLSITRSIVEAHAGRIWATRNPERGLTIHIELPCLE